MIGIVISDSFLLIGQWDKSDTGYTLNGVDRIDFNEPISSLIFSESDLNSILASALRRAKEIHTFDGADVFIGLPDSFVEHSVIENDRDLSRSDLIDYFEWVNNQKQRPPHQSVYIYGQVYFPSESNIHVCLIPRALVRTLKLSITEMGGYPSWMGPVSTLYLDGSSISEAAIIHRNGSRYSFMKVQNNRFDMGIVTFSGGIARVSATTDKSEDITLAALGLEKSDLDDIPVFSPQKLGRQATSAWEFSDFRPSTPFEEVNINSPISSKIPRYEANILSQLITANCIGYSLNFFEEPGITDFFYTQVIPVSEELKDINDPLNADVEITDSESGKEATGKNEITRNKGQSFTGFSITVLLIVISFIGFNYLKLQDQINSPMFGISKDFTIERSGFDSSYSSIDITKGISSDLLKHSKAISSSILSLLTETDLNRYNALTITKSFLSLEYLSGSNPNIENILGVEPTSFSVEATGKDSTVFLWYYSFELPPSEDIYAPGKISKMDLMEQLDTTLNDYSLKYFEQVFTKNQIYGPLLIWVRGKADILQASAIFSNVENDILLRKFVLFNKSDKPNPRAGFYVSILED
jgi:hypothetical protein